jgi:hypothetical protein
MAEWSREEKWNAYPKHGANSKVRLTHLPAPLPIAAARLEAGYQALSPKKAATDSNRRACAVAGSVGGGGRG